MMRSKRYIKFLSALVAAVLFLGIFPAISLAENFSAVVTAKGMDVYANASLTGASVTLPKGTVVVVNEVSDGVAQITYKNKTVYCDYGDLTAVEDIAYKAYVNASGVRVYAKPDTSSKSVSVDKGTVVNLLAVSGSWALIEKNGYGAFIYKGYLTLVEDEATPTPEPTATPEPTETPVIDEIEAVVTTDSLTVYQSASTSSDKLCTLEYGTTVTVLAYNSTWAYITKGGSYGYCKRAGLTAASAIETATATPAPTETPAPTATVNPDDYIPAVVTADSVPVYASASTSSSKLGTLKKGTEVNVVEYNSKWAYIEKNGYFGYCATSALKKVSVEATATPTPAPSNADRYREKYPDVQFSATVIMDDAPAYTDPDDLSVYNALSLGTEVDVYAYNSNWAYVGIGDSRGFVQVKYLSAADYSELSSGSSGSDVLKLQTALEALGYFDGTPGGSYSTLTAAAVKRLQSELGFSQTGTADTVLLRILYGGYAPECSMVAAGLASGDTGANVERLQTRLYYLGYLSKTSSIDGDYGSTTSAAVKLFQAEADLTADGTADAQTLRAMYKNNAPTLPSGTNAADYSSSSSSGGSSSSGVTTMPKELASTTSSLGSNATTADKIEYVIYIAQNQLGKPYIYGTAGPDSYDCSGLTTYAFKKVNISLGRSAYAQGYQSSSGTKIESMSDLKRGDIVCFNTISDSDLVDHVGIYLGGGYFIHASSGTSNGKQVCISSLTSGYYNRVFSWGRRPLE